MPEENIVASAVASYKESNGIEASAENYDAPEPVSDPVVPDEPAAPEIGEDNPDEVVAEVPATPEPTVVPVSEIPPTDEGELGPEKDKWGRVNRIPQPRVAKIVAKAVAKQEEAFATERTAHAAKIAEHDKRFKEIDNVERLMFDEQDKFLGILDTIPGYKERLAARYGGAVAPTVRVPMDDEDPMPGPDTEGGYSQKGLAAWGDWNGRQVEKRIAARQQKEREEQESVTKRQQAVSNYATQAAAEARSWPGFKENEAEIVALMAADARVTHESAYRRIVLPKLETDKTKLAAEIRAQVIADLKKAPASTGTAPTPAKRVAPVSDGPRDTSDIIRDAIRAAK